MISCYLNFGLFFIILGAFGTFQGYTLYKNTGIAYGPGQYLLIVSLLIFVIGAVYYIQEVKKNRKLDASPVSAEPDALPAEEQAAPPQGVASCFTLRLPVGKREIKIGPAILAFALFTLYAILSQWIGYLISTVLFIASSMLLFGERLWWKLTLFALVGGGAFWAVFVKIAGIPL